MFLGSVYMSWMLDCDGNHVMGMSLFEVLLVWVTLPAPWCNYQIIVKVEIYSLAAPHFMEKKFILRHFGKQPWQFWDLSWASKGFLLRNTPSRQGTMSACVLPWFYPPRTVFQNEWREILAVIVEGVYVGLGLGLYYLYASANTAGWNGSQAIRSILVDGQKSCRCINQPRRRWKIVGKR